MCHRILFSLIITSNIIVIVSAAVAAAAVDDDNDDDDDGENHCRLAHECDYTKNDSNCHCPVTTDLYNVYRYEQLFGFLYSFGGVVSIFYSQ